MKRAGVPFARVTPEQFRRVSKTERASGVAAILRQRVQRLDQVKLTDHECWTALSHVRSPGNLGTLLRTSAATGAAGFILLGDSIDPFDPAAVRATMGALFVPYSWVAANKKNLNVTDRGEKSYWHVALTTVENGALAINVSRIGEKLLLEPYSFEFGKPSLQV